MRRITTCPVCDGSAFTELVELAGVPVFCNVLFDDPDAARAAPTGDIVLASCGQCSHIVNVEFDEARLAYSAAYENSLHHSPTFQAFAEELARRLIGDHDLTGRQVVELGCGKGDFLALLAEAGATESIGFDPSYEGTHDTYRGPGSVTIVTEPFQAAGRDLRPALVASRHVLEHLTDPGSLLEGVAQWRECDPVVYLEVPDADHMVEQLAVWDVIYEHASYFTAASLTRLCERHDLTPTRVESTFGGQYLSVEARLGGPEPSPARTPADPAAFGPAFAELRRRWTDRLEKELAATQRLAIWGAGSKGVSFVALAGDAGRAIDLAVDLNPAKQGRFLPVSGVEVVGPDDPRLRGLGLVLTMNPHYEREIRADLDSRGIDAPLEVV